MFEVVRKSEGRLFQVGALAQDEQGICHHADLVLHAEGDTLVESVTGMRLIEDAEVDLFGWAELSGPAVRLVREANVATCFLVPAGAEFVELD